MSEANNVALDDITRLEERVSPGTLPGLFHNMMTTEALGGLSMTDITAEQEGWSFQPQSSNDSLSPEAQTLMDAFCETRLHYHPRKMQLVLPDSICSRSKWGVGEDTNVFERLPIKMIGFVIPPDHPEVQFEVDRDQDNDSVNVRVTDMGERVDSLRTEVTCFHPIEGFTQPELNSETGLLYHEGDFYLSKENMTINSKLLADKTRLDRIDHEKMKGHASVHDNGVAVGPWPRFLKNISLTRTTRAGDDVSLDLTALYNPSQKNVTRPEATDSYSHVTVRRDSDTVCSDVRFLVPARMPSYTPEQEEEILGMTGHSFTEASLWSSITA
ncbi:hypothetical protein L202_06641 [Cryptococcus amylolentus CBS 6039]|uniref:Uncharacterized protein n=1 Tax=Cryptococcus amylolentus CBS 6039 TaxID=1295533 RepID=A0A1E3HHB3_9TREE|nr:hypothetical protein L202_06641 [Cryptococcus amylolentus CBS 6039]ODN75515.1 hypothetical protein L202_06641 [Cryptococcus amylolentus CBS 6039]